MITEYEPQKPANVRCKRCRQYYGDGRHLSCYGVPVSEVPYKKSLPLSFFSLAVKIAKGQKRAAN